MDKQQGRPRGERGVSRAELILVIGCVIVLVVVVVVSIAGIDSGISDRECRSGQRLFKAAVEQYKAEHGAYPAHGQTVVDAGLLEGSGRAAANDWQVAIGIDGQPIYAPAPDGRCA